MNEGAGACRGRAEGVASCPRSAHAPRARCHFPIRPVSHRQRTKMSNQWLKGVVKEVTSGDSLTIVGGAKPGAVPVEKRLTLASLIAPKLVGGTRSITCAFAMQQGGLGGRLTGR